MGAFYGGCCFRRSLREYRCSIFTPLYEGATDAESFMRSDVAENVNLCNSGRSILEFQSLRAKMKVTPQNSAPEKLGAKSRIFSNVTSPSALETVMGSCGFSDV